MSIKEELGKLKESDIWSFMLFALYKVMNVPEFSGLGELAYVLDKKNLLRLCEYFGGTTITIPTIDELELMLYGLLLYNYIDIEHLSPEEAILLISERSNIDIKAVKSSYKRIKEVLSEYSFSSRGKF